MKTSRSVRFGCVLVLIEIQTYAAMTFNVDTTTPWQTTTTDALDYTTGGTTTDALDFTTADTTTDALDYTTADTTTDALDYTTADTTTDALDYSTADTTTDALDYTTADTTTDALDYTTADTTTDALDYSTADTTTDALDYTTADPTTVVDTTDMATTSCKDKIEEATADDHMIIIILAVCVGVLVAIVVGLVLLVVRLKRNAKAKEMQHNVENTTNVNDNMYELLGNAGPVNLESGNDSNLYQTLESQNDPAVNKDKTGCDNFDLYENTMNRKRMKTFFDT